MGTRTHRAPRCPTCRMHLHACVCSTIPRLDLVTHVELIMHRRERDKPTATGELAVRCLVHGRVHVHGHEDAPVDLRGLDTEGRRLLLLFPSDDARVLTPELIAEDPRPVTLVVPDGSWRQASRIARRVPGLEGATHVVLAPDAPSTYQLRRETRPGGLATFEAIARALGVLEGAEVRAELELLFDRVVGAVLASRQPPGGGGSHERSARGGRGPGGG